MLKNHLLFFFALLVAPCIAQQSNKIITPKSVYVEFAYVDIPEEDQLQKMMFGNTRLKIYSDARYSMLESVQQTNGGLKSVVIRDNKSGDTYICVEMDTLKIKMKQEDTNKLADLFGMPNDSTQTWKSLGDFKQPIMEYTARDWLISNPDAGDYHIFISDRITPAEDMSQSPLFIYRDGKYLGMMLGYDRQPYGSFTLHMRAVAIETDRPKDIGAELAAFRTVTEAEGNTLLQKAIMGN